MAKLKLTVLMSIYCAEKPDYFNASLRSIWDDQIVKPDEIILVEDGALTTALSEIVHNWKNRLGNQLRIISLQDNVGLGCALNEGLKLCSNDLIARMDTDDVALPGRFHEQTEFLREHQSVDVVGSWIEEIDGIGQLLKKTVEYPLDNKACRSYFKKRDPFAHSSVMFRKSFFEKAGNYPPFRKNQDSLLWAKGFKAGCIFANIPRVLLHFRRTDDLLKRRANKNELLLFLNHRLKINRDLEYGMDADMYAYGYFLLQNMPNFIKKIAYKYMR